jgi:hypothetical protein
MSQATKRVSKEAPGFPDLQDILGNTVWSSIYVPKSLRLEIGDDHTR